MSPSLQNDLVQSDWSEGEVRDVAPALISPNGAEAMTDVFLDEDGNPYRRGGSKYLTPEGLGSEGLTWGWDGYLLPGQRTVIAGLEDFGALTAEDKGVVNIGGAGLTKPKQSGVLADLLYIGGGTLYGGSLKSGSYSTGTISVTNGSKVVTGSSTTWNTLVDAGMLLRIGTERVYVVASIDSTTQLTLRDAYQGTTGTGKSYSLNPTVATGTGPYQTFDYVTVCANRFVFAVGRTIKFTEVNNPHTFTNSLGTTNEHTLPEGITINGLATIGQICIVFTTGGIWTLEGLALSITDLNGNSQHKIQLLSGDVVLAGAPGIAAYGQTLVVPAGDGVYLIDGVSQPRRISKPIERPYRQYIHDGMRVGGAVVFNSHYFLPMTLGINSVKSTFVCRLDRPTSDRSQTIYPWGRLSGDGGLASCFFRRIAADPQEPRLLATQSSAPSRPMDCTGYFEPGNAIQKDADGSWADLEIITRAYGTGGDTINVVRKLRALYELVDNEEGDAALAFSYNDGSNKQTGEPWGKVEWGGFKWGGSSGSWTPLGELGPSDGRDPGNLRVDKRSRHVRLRIRSVGPTPLCVLRSLELKIRPSEAIRR